MANLNEQGNIQARCPGCEGAMSTFEWRGNAAEFGGITKVNVKTSSGVTRNIDHRLFRCAGCGRGGLGTIAYQAAAKYPGSFSKLIDFHPEVVERLPLPSAVPPGIATEFREAEACLDAKCHRAAAGLFRSVLDKTMRGNGYKVKNGTTLEQQNRHGGRGWHDHGIS